MGAPTFLFSIQIGYLFPPFPALLLRYTLKPSIILRDKIKLLLHAFY